MIRFRQRAVPETTNDRARMYARTLRPLVRPEPRPFVFAILLGLVIVAGLVCLVCVGTP